MRCIVVSLAVVLAVAVVVIPVAAQDHGEDSFRRVAAQADAERKQKQWGFLDRPTTPDSLLPNIKPVGADRPKIVGNAADSARQREEQLKQWNADWDREQAQKKAAADVAAQTARIEAQRAADFNSPSAVANRNAAARAAKSDAIRQKKICGRDALVGAGRCMTNAFCAKTGGKPNPQARCETAGKVCCVGGDARRARAQRTANRAATKAKDAAEKAAYAAKMSAKRGAQKKGGGLRTCGSGGQCVAEKACRSNGGQVNKGSSADACNAGAKKQSLVCCVGFNLTRAKERKADKNKANAKPCQIAPTGTFKFLKGKKPGVCTPSHKAGPSCQGGCAGNYKCCPK